MPRKQEKNSTRVINAALRQAQGSFKVGEPVEPRSG